MVARLDKLLSRSLGFRFAVVNRARHAHRRTRSRNARNVKSLGCWTGRDPAHDARNQWDRDRGLGKTGRPCARRMAAAVTLDYRFQRHGAIDVEFSDLRRAYLCLCGLEPRGKPATAAAGEVACTRWRRLESTSMSGIRN